jgi:hypothetical protein
MNPSTSKKIDQLAKLHGWGMYKSGGIANSVRELSFKTQFRPWITKTTVFSTQTFATDSISSLNYENDHFGPWTFAYGSNSSLSDSRIPFFYPYSLRTAHC